MKFPGLFAYFLFGVHCGTAQFDSVRESAGQHLAHVAKTFGVAQECPGGWLRRRRRWVLPPHLRFLGEVIIHSIYLFRCEILYEVLVVISGPPPPLPHRGAVNMG
jgi:hypothetical protein